jgi:hypothetical protein
MYKALSYIATDEEIMATINNSARIFKLSGRYVVTDKFDITQFDNTNTQNKYVFKRRESSWIPPADTGVNHLLQTRLYSFTPSLFNETIALFKAIIDNMLTVYNQQKYIDVEHSMAKFIPEGKLVEIERVGLMGNIAPNGMMIID